MRKVELNMKEQTKYEIVKRFVDNNCTNYKNLSILLESSLKTAYNYVKKYKTHGKLAFKHGNNNRKPKNTKSQDFCNKILDIFDKIDCDINFKHFQVILKRDYHISVSYNFLYNLLTKHETIPLKPKKKLEKNFAKILNLNYLSTFHFLKLNKRLFLIIYLMILMLTLVKKDLNILVNLFKWMLLNIFGLVILKLIYTLR